MNIQIFLTALSLNFILAEQWPLVTLSLLIRNKEYALSNVFAHIEDLDYPKSAINLFIRTDHNSDQSWKLVSKWLDFWSSKYNDVNVESKIEECKRCESANWTTERQLRTASLYLDAWIYASQVKSLFWFNIDADVIIINNQTLKILINDLRSTSDGFMVGPLLNCPSRDDLANFWPEVNYTTGLFNELLSEEFEILKSRKQLALKPVDLVHTTFLVKAFDIDRIEFMENLAQIGKPFDPRYFAIFTICSFIKRKNFGQILLDNREFFGYYPSPVANNFDLDFEKEIYRHLKLEVEALKLAKWLEKNKFDRKEPWPTFLDPFKSSDILPKTSENYLSNFNLDEFYVINLKDRVERLNYMNFAFKTLNISATFVSGVDGKFLNLSLLKLLGIKMLENYTDPYMNHPMKLGEVACFLSHYYIWLEILDRRLGRVAIFEDDVRFSYNFAQGLPIALKEASARVPNWDLLYLGRKPIQREQETFLKDSKFIIKPFYSYWTIGYILNYEGAKKLVESNPLEKLLPVDEYLPIMYNKHPNREWSNHFKKRTLIALATFPPLVEPLFFEGSHQYISDTKDSEIGPWSQLFNG